MDITILSKNFPLVEASIGEYANMSGKGMKFSVKKYYAIGLGSVSTLSANGMLGLMKMETVVINPFELDMPLLSYDRIKAASKDTLLVELYDTLLSERTEYAELTAKKYTLSDIADYNLGAHWYDDIKLAESVAKSGSKKNAKHFDNYADDFLSTYIKLCKTAKPCDSVFKKKKASEYVEGLLKNGGPSTDAFKKIIGEKKTKELFRKVIFGIA